MKKLPHRNLTLAALALGMTLLSTQCASSPASDANERGRMLSSANVDSEAGRITSDRTYQWQGKTYREQRVLLSSNPPESMVRVIEVPHP